MKTEEDEAFDDLARRQGMWGGGYQAKRQMAADKFIAAEERKVGERYGYIPKLHPSEWMDEPAHCQCPACKDGVIHASDCAVHTGPAYSLGPCDCGVEKGQEEDWGALAEKQLASIKRDTQASFEDAMVCATHKVMAEFEAQPAQEPVAWMYDWLCDGKLITGWIAHNEAEIPKLVASNIRPLYTTPPKREWVGLTDGDLLQIRETVQVVEGRSLLQSLTKAIEQALKEKNG